MPEFFAQIAQPLLIGLLLTALIDAVSGDSVLRRPLRSWPVHVALLSLAFCAELLVFRRPWFACSQMLVLQGVVLAVSAVKMKSMREPFVFQDFEYFIDMLRHPRLYLPFFGLTKLALVLSGVGAMIYFSMRLEADLAGRIGWLSFMDGWLVLTSAAAGLLWLSTRRPFAIGFDPQADLRALGMSTCLAAYAAAERQALPLRDRFAATTLLPDAPLPHIVAVQSESFFDARRMRPGISGDVYAWLDDLKAEAWQHGLFEVPAIGANTVRTEFAFLSGLHEEALGVHRFNPYRSLPWRGVRTLAHRLRKEGYRTVCVHPYVGSFYRRDQAYRLLGFDAFIDISAFGPADRSGPFVGDVAVAALVNQLLAAAQDKPLFVFAITMENHGPLHMESISAYERARLLGSSSTREFDDLAIYLRHVRNAGIMAERLRNGLMAQSRPGMLCWYGDHVPIMPRAYAGAGFDDPRTDYFIWHTAYAKALGTVAAAVDLPAADLATTLLDVRWRAAQFRPERNPRLAS